MVAGDHHHSYAGLLAELYRFPGLLSGQVSHARQADKYQVAPDMRILQILQLAGEVDIGGGDDSKRLAGHIRVGLRDNRRVFFGEGDDLLSL
ncbi:hypothetical protein ES703_59193 [subsurface metagenome]